MVFIGPLMELCDFELGLNPADRSRLIKMGGCRTSENEMASN